MLLGRIVLMFPVLGLYKHFWVLGLVVLVTLGQNVVIISSAVCLLLSPFQHSVDALLLRLTWYHSSPRLCPLSFPCLSFSRGMASVCVSFKSPHLPSRDF